MKVISKIGIMQGRLTNYSIDKLSIYPKAPSVEIEIAKKHKLSHIEFLSEEYFNKNNLIWSDKKIEIITQKLKTNKIKKISFIDNYSVKNSIVKNNSTYYKKLINQVKKLRVKNFIIPLLGSSKINNQNYFKFIEPLNQISNYCSLKKINFLVETDIDYKLYKKIKKKIKNNLGIVFDTGNNSHVNSDYINQIKLFKNHIQHVHLKDKNKKDKNVMFGAGIVDFKSIFSTLKSINYKGYYTLESTRGDNAQKTLISNLKYIKKCL